MTRVATLGAKQRGCRRAAIADSQTAEQPLNLVLRWGVRRGRGRRFCPHENVCRNMAGLIRRHRYTWHPAIMIAAMWVPKKRHQVVEPHPIAQACECDTLQVRLLGARDIG